MNGETKIVGAICSSGNLSLRNARRKRSMERKLNNSTPIGLDFYRCFDSYGLSRRTHRFVADWSKDKQRRGFLVFFYDKVSI